MVVGWRGGSAARPLTGRLKKCRNCGDRPQESLIFQGFPDVGQSATPLFGHSLLASRQVVTPERANRQGCHSKMNLSSWFIAYFLKI